MRQLAQNSTRRLLLVDANVLIDYVKVDQQTVLQLVARHVGEVYVPSTVLAEVEGLDAGGCEALGLRVVEPEPDELVAAAARRGPLSLQDHLCIILARGHGWTCVTNDTALRKVCGVEKIPVLWGLELLLELVRRAQLAASEALAIALAIHQVNPFHITAAIVARFEKRLKELA